MYGSREGGYDVGGLFGHGGGDFLLIDAGIGHKSVRVTL